MEVPNLRQSLAGFLQPENWSFPQFYVEIRELSLDCVTKNPASFPLSIALSTQRHKPPGQTQKVNSGSKQLAWNPAGDFPAGFFCVRAGKCLVPRSRVDVSFLPGSRSNIQNPLEGCLIILTCQIPTTLL